MTKDLNIQSDDMKDLFCHNEGEACISTDRIMVDGKKSAICTANILILTEIADGDLLPEMKMSSIWRILTTQDCTL